MHGLDDYYIVAVGLQECRAGSWVAALQAGLKGGFALLSVVTMWRMTICVFIRREAVEDVANLETCSKATGIGKIIGNKGGVLVSFTVKDTSFCFISAHLAAKPNGEAARKANYNDLIRFLRTGVRKLESTFQFDYTFWMGDFNFRIDGTFEEVVELVEKGDLGTLKDLCQLFKARNNNFLFSDFMVWGEKGMI